ncbi:XRE family transcriptional regulator [Stenotrophomonas sp. ATCM1_4]|nr:XRE family transcriptional regulator [Stenotrophomonas sp. ATCM1_4]
MGDMAARTRIARLRAEMTQGQLVERIGMTCSAVANWEISTRSNPNIANLVSIAIETNASFEWKAIGHGDMELKV